MIEIPIDYRLLVCNATDRIVNGKEANFYGFDTIEILGAMFYSAIAFYGFRNIYYIFIKQRKLL